MKSVVSFLVIIIAATTLHGQPQLADKVVGIIDDRIILMSDVEGQYLQSTYQVTSAIPPDFRCQILNSLLTEKLLVAQSLIDSIEVTDEEVESELERRIRSFSSVAGSIEKLEEYYGKSIIEMKDEFRPQVKEQLQADRERATIVTDLKVTPSDVNNFYNSIPKDSLPYYNTEIELGELVIYPKVSEAVKEYSKQKIEDLLKRIRNGEDFSKLASAYSEDPGSADKGGELGFVNRGELDPSFEAAAFALKKPNDVSDVVQSAFGFHIIQLIERRGDRINVRHILIRPKTTSFDITRAGKLADSVFYLIQSGTYSFAEAVNKFSEDENSKNNAGMLQNPSTGSLEFDITELGSYDQSLVPATDTLQVGAVSKPIIFRNEKGETGYRILYLKAKTRPHQANLKDDYDKIQEIALTKKQGDAVTQWLRTRIAKSYVYVSPEYRNCKVISKWISNEQQ
jgi:peptidyl-prolyl cis-trans isomerase SurA